MSVKGIYQIFSPCFITGIYIFKFAYNEDETIAIEKVRVRKKVAVKKKIKNYLWLDSLFHLILDEA